MEPIAIKVAIGTLAISFFNLIGIVTNSWFIYKTYKENRRLEFLQRRDHLSQKIAELNGRNNEARLISARYVIVAVKNAGLPLQGEQAEENTAVVASIKEDREAIEKLIKRCDEEIEEFHVKYSRLALETDAPEVERMIAIVQVASEDLRKANGDCSSRLHILETSNEVIKTTLAESDEKKRQIDLDFERAIGELK